MSANIARQRAMGPDEQQLKVRSVFEMIVPKTYDNISTVSERDTSSTDTEVRDDGQTSIQASAPLIGVRRIQQINESRVEDQRFVTARSFFQSAEDHKHSFPIDRQPFRQEVTAV